MTKEQREELIAMQKMVNSGAVWRMEGSYGRAAMRLMKAGCLCLGHTAHTDYWGNRVPSRTEVKAGTKGSASFLLPSHRFLAKIPATLSPDLNP